MSTYSACLHIVGINTFVINYGIIATYHACIRILYSHRWYIELHFKLSPASYTVVTVNESVHASLIYRLCCNINLYAMEIDIGHLQVRGDVNICGESEVRWVEF